MTNRFAHDAPQAEPSSADPSSASSSNAGSSSADDPNAAPPSNVEGTVPSLDPALLASRLILAELRAEALRAGMIDADGVRLLDVASLRLSPDATLPEAPSLIARLRTAKPWLFTRSTSSPAAPPSSVPSAPRRATEMTEQEWRQARADLLRQR